MIKLKPCPFCGHEPDYFEYGEESVPFTGVINLTWGCESGDECPGELGKPVPVEIWNKRVNE